LDSGAAGGHYITFFSKMQRFFTFSEKHFDKMRNKIPQKNNLIFF